MSDKFYNSVEVRERWTVTDLKDKFTSDEAFIECKNLQII